MLINTLCVQGTNIQSRQDVYFTILFIGKGCSVLQWLRSIQIRLVETPMTVRSGFGSYANVGVAHPWLIDLPDAEKVGKTLVAQVSQHQSQAPVVGLSTSMMYVQGMLNYRYKNAIIKLLYGIATSGQFPAERHDKIV